MRILVVGGTGFLGGATTREAVRAGHQVTVMTRSGGNVADGAATLICDRLSELPSLAGQFDAIIDTCAYTPDMVTSLATAVGPAHYVLVSSISVYSDMSTPQFDESASAPAATQDDLDLAAQVDPQSRCLAEPYGASYGRLKRACERAADTAFETSTHVRLGLIVGPEDYTQRFTWWVRRCDQPGPILAPDPPERNIQLIDVRDAAAFLLRCAEQQLCETFNLTGEPIAFCDLLEAILAQTGRTKPIRYLPFACFVQAGLRHWTEMPLILPEVPTLAEMLNASTAKAQKAGLVTRPLDVTIAAVLSWDRNQRDTRLLCGMSAEQEAVVRSLAAR